MSMQQVRQKHGAAAISVAAEHALEHEGWDPWTAVMLRYLRRLEFGRLTLDFWDGRCVRLKGRRPGPSGHLRFKCHRGIRRLVLGGDIGFAEAYMAGDCDSGDLVSAIEVFARNVPVLDRRVSGMAAVRLLNLLRHRFRANTRQGSRRNIAYHYDLGNAFYAHWLDPSMTYSSALYDSQEQSLEDAQTAKYARVADALDLRDGDHVLEIGCGWGGLAEYLASARGCRVTGLTLSREQLDFARRRIARAGLSDRVEFRLQDYRDVGGTYDRIASIEMVEAVGERNWPTYFSVLRDRLADSGVAVLQAITIADDRFESYRRNADFIQRYIFPGGMLPSPGLLRRLSDGAGFWMAGENRFGASYVRTLEAWRRRFAAAWPEIGGLGFDDRFRAMWTYYLAYCEAGFRAGAIDVGHYTLRRR